jgi:hypothetical protein
MPLYYLIDPSLHGRRQAPAQREIAVCIAVAGRDPSHSSVRVVLIGRSLSKEPVAALTQQQVQEWPNEVNSEPDYSNPQDLLDNREIVLKYHHSHPDVANDRNEQTCEYRDPGGATN